MLHTGAGEDTEGEAEEEEVAVTQKPWAPGPGVPECQGDEEDLSRQGRLQEEEGFGGADAELGKESKVHVIVCSCFCEDTFLGKII
jgi:hypothetical protein